jgi:uncharacterized protein YigE (DUF2233 family)
MKALRLAACYVVLTWASGALAVGCNAVKFVDKKFTVCRVDVHKEHVQLFLHDENGQPFNYFDRLADWLRVRGQKLVFAMNAGMYHSDFSAVGLFVAGGRQFTPLNTNNGDGNFFLKPNGVFAITKQGARVLAASEYLGYQSQGYVLLATQSGPLLVHNGKLHPVFKANSTSRLLRNGVGVSSFSTALFVMGETPVNFYEFATFFRDQLHCQNALFLDGSVSSLYMPALQRDDSQAELGPIIAVTE